MSDLVFLLLIFFMITSTLISPNAIPLNLPESSSDTRVKQDLTVYITYQNEVAEFYIGEKPIAAASLQDELRQALEGSAPDAAVVVRADKSLPVEQVVYTLDAVEQINRADNENHKHKVTLATKGQ
jgi:biopolymer transport protein ExbD